MGVSNDLKTSVSTQAPCTSKCMLTQKIKFKYDQSQTANQIFPNKTTTKAVANQMVPLLPGFQLRDRWTCRRNEV